MLFCVILFVPRGACFQTRRKKIDAFLVPEHMKKKVLLLLCVAIFFPDRREEKPIDALVCDLFCSQTGEKVPFDALVYDTLCFQTRRKQKLMLLSVILFVPRRETRKTF